MGSKDDGWGMLRWEVRMMDGDVAMGSEDDRIGEMS
jgi:hypothetical protein